MLTLQGAHGDTGPKGTMGIIGSRVSILHHCVSQSILIFKKKLER